MSGRLPTGLRMYRLLSAAARPFVPILLARRVKRGKEHRHRLSERRGENHLARPEDPLVWLHGASVGELASVLPLIDRICARGINMLVTTGTVTSGGLAQQRLPRGVVHQFDNRGDIDARALSIVTPGVLGPDYFREAAAVLDAAAGGPPDLAALGDVLRRHGFTPAN